MISTAWVAVISLTVSGGALPAWETAARSWVEADWTWQGAKGEALKSAVTQRDEATRQLRAHPPRAEEIGRAIRSGDPGLRLAAMACVVVLEHSTEEIVHLLVNVLETNDLRQRLMAVRALARSDGAWTAQLESRISVALLRDPSPGVRIEATPLLLRMEASHAAPIFAVMFGESVMSCPSFLFQAVASLGPGMVSAVAAAIDAGGTARAREAFVCAKRTAQAPDYAPSKLDPR